MRAWGVAAVIASCGVAPPAPGDRLVVAAPPRFTARASILLSGTKPANTVLMIGDEEIEGVFEQTRWRDIIDLAEGDNTFEIRAIGATAEEQAQVAITRDTRPPSIAHRSPSYGSTSVPIDAVVEATFDELLDCEHAGERDLLLVDTESGKAVPGSISCRDVLGGSLLRLTPHQLLAPRRTYGALLSTEIRDRAGNRSPGIVAWTFTAGARASEPPESPALLSPSAHTGERTIEVAGMKPADSALLVGTVDDPEQMVRFVPITRDPIWSITLDLGVGRNVFYLRSEDRAGRISNDSARLIIERSGPSAL